MYKIPYPKTTSPNISLRNFKSNSYTYFIPFQIRYSSPLLTSREEKMASKVAPKITLYTSHTCPWAHRSQIALRELNLDFETVIVDLSKPRTPEYLRINPRGLVPALDYNGNVLTESAIVSQFLVDAHPSHLEKASTDEGGPLQRAKINFFVDTFSSKIFGLFMGAARAATGAEKDAATTTFVEGIVKEIEPLLADANPFFGGASKLTLVEVSPLSQFLGDESADSGRYKLVHSFFGLMPSPDMKICFRRLSVLLLNPRHRIS